MCDDIIDCTQAEEELRKALQAAQARIAQYEQAVSMISDIVWSYDVNTKGEHVGSYISPVADRMLGLPVGTIGDNFEKYFSDVHPDDFPAVQETLLEGVRTREKDKTAEYRIRKADGTILWVRSKGLAYYYPDGRVTVHGTTSDITERKRAEEILKAERLKLDIVTQNIGAGLAIISRDYQTVWANNVIKKIFGDVEGKSCHLTYNQRDTVCPDCGVKKVFEHCENVAVHEQSGKDEHGETIWSEIIATPIRDDKGMIMEALELVVPITVRKRAVDKLQESEARYRRIVETASEGIMILDTQFCFAFVNQKLADMLGYLPVEMLDRPVISIIFEEDLPDHLATMEKRAAGAGGQYERRLRRKDGSSCWTIVSATVLRDEAGQFTGSFAMLTDITERKKADEALKESELRFRTMVEMAPDAIFIVNKTGAFIEVNAVACKQIGYTREQLLSRHV